MIDRLRAWWSRPLDDGARRRTVALACAVMVAAAVVALAGTSGERQSPPGHPPTGPAIPASPAARTAESPAATVPSEDGAGGADDQPSPADIGGAKDAGRRFLRGYLGYTYGRADAEAIDAATPELTRGLTASPPRVPASERRRRARLETLQVDAATSREARLLALVDDGRRRYSLTLALVRAGRRWSVADVGA